MISLLSCACANTGSEAGRSVLSGFLYSPLVLATSLIGRLLSAVFGVTV